MQIREAFRKNKVFDEDLSEEFLFFLLKKPTIICLARRLKVRKRCWRSFKAVQKYGNLFVMNEEEKKAETIAEKEEKILKFWQDNKIFEKTLEKKAPRGEFVFYDGPPFATGLPHYGHLLQSIIKDAIPRYKTMRGYRVPRNWGWDCHGLPIENLVEKELGLKTKKDIETFGIEKFNKAAEESVLRYAGDWKKIIPRIGRFVDMEHDYKTMDKNFTESIWWVFKTLYDKGLIYTGHKPMHICPRCGTTLANFEVSLNYKDISDISVFVKFELADEPGTFLLAWTTTPWTLPGNVALAVGEDIDYVKIELNNLPAQAGEKYILAKSRLEIIKGEYKILEEFKGEKLIGKKYKPAFDYYAKDKSLENWANGWKVYPADFVTTGDGTGIVHIAPAFGEDDMRLGLAEKLPFIQHVSGEGNFKPEVSDFAGIPVKPKDNPQSADILILKKLAEKGILFAKEKITHSYPHCWRCDTPLLNYASDSWFVDVGKVKDKMIANNKKINWVPENIREGRFGKWLEGARDWAISRQRYWGAPLPVWKCDKCDEVKIVGGLDDLKELTSSGNKYFVMRHGEAQSNLKDYYSGLKFQKDNHLTEKGKKQILASAKKIKKEKFDLIFSSDFTRTRETAEISAEVFGIPKDKIIYDERLREVNPGIFDGGPIDDYRNYFSTMEERFVKAAPEAETDNQIKNRVTSFLFDLDKKYKGKKILIVTHGDPSWLLISGSRGYNPHEAAELKRDKKDLLKNADVREVPFAPFPHNENYELNLHRPYIDEIVFGCKCGGKMKRILDVFDCWFESGSMPYGQMHYPFENKKEFGKKFPADFIGEALDQTRGWFYSLLVLSSALFNKSAYLNVVTTGLVLAEDGQKMSKRLKNYPDPMDIVGKYGADALRYFMLSSPIVRGEDLNFSEKGVDEVYKKIILRLHNVYTFYELYAGETSPRLVGLGPKAVKSKNILDLWILSRLGEVLKDVSIGFEKYELDKASRPIADFVDDLSTWFVRRSRERFKGDDGKDKNFALATLKTVILELSKMMAPLMPFIADGLYQKAGGKLESVHLEKWSDAKDFKVDKKLIEEMAKARKIVSVGLEERARAGVKVRQPLQSLKVGITVAEEYLFLIKDEVNVKEIIFDKKLGDRAELDLKMTESLKEEGNLRDLVRNIQEMRKNAGLNPNQGITLEISCGNTEKKFLEKYGAEFSRIVGVKKLVFSDDDFKNEIKVGGMTFNIGRLIA